MSVVTETAKIIEARKVEAARMVAEGMSIPKAAKTAGIGASTLRRHLKNVEASTTVNKTEAKPAEKVSKPVEPKAVKKAPKPKTAKPKAEVKTPVEKKVAKPKKVAAPKPSDDKKTTMFDNINIDLGVAFETGMRKPNMGRVSLINLMRKYLLDNPAMLTDRKAAKQDFTTNVLSKYPDIKEPTDRSFNGAYGLARDEINAKILTLRS